LERRALCEVLNWELDDYSERKSREFVALGLLLERFEPVTLRQALDGYLDDRQDERTRSLLTVQRPESLEKTS
jgi:hypothetical protein